MQRLKKIKIPHTFLSAIACMQIFTGTPELILNQEGAESAAMKASPVTVKLSRGDSTNIPPQLLRALTPLLEQGFYVMGWEVSPVETGFMVDLYHSDPARLGSDRDDFRTAASRGMGVSIRRFVRAQN